MAFLHKSSQAGFWAPGLAPRAGVPLEIDRNHPLARDLCLAIPLHDGKTFDLASGGYGPFAGASLAATARGGAMDVTGTTASVGIVFDSSLTMLNLTGDMSVVVWAKPTSFAGDRALVTRSYGANSQPAPVITGLISTSGNAFLWRGDGNSNYRLYTGTAPSTGQWSQFAFTSPSGNTSAIIYINGSQVFSGAAGTTAGSAAVGTSPGNIINPLVGSCLGPTPRPFLGQIQNAMAWNRVLSSDEINWLKAEPFAPYRPIARRRVYTASAGVTPTRRPFITIAA